MSKLFPLTDLRDLQAKPNRSLIHRALTDLATQLSENKVKSILAAAYYPHSSLVGSMEAWIEELGRYDATPDEIRKMIRILSVDERAAGRNTAIFNYAMVRLKSPEQQPDDPPFGRGRYLFAYRLAPLGNQIGAMYLWDKGYRAISTAPEESDNETDPFAERFYADWEN